MEESRTLDGRDLMTPDAGKWQRISDEIMQLNVSSCHRDGAACKSKWNQMIPEYKRIVDFLARTSTNEPRYWTLSAVEKKAEGLPRSFPRDVFFQIHTWYGSRPTVTPPHTRDLLSHDNINYKIPELGGEDGDQGDFSADTEEHVFGDAIGDSDGIPTSTQSPSVATDSAKVRVVLGVPPLSPSVAPSTSRKGYIPPGVTPQLLSSSYTNSTLRRQPGSTAVRKKSVSGHSLIAEATRTTGDAMTLQMKEMAESSRDLERTKLDVQNQHFSQQMEYQHDRDTRIFDTTQQVNANAKLSIEKQGEVVQCLAQLVSVLSLGLQRCASQQASAGFPTYIPQHMQAPMPPRGAPPRNGQPEPSSSGHEAS